MSNFDFAAAIAARPSGAQTAHLIAAYGNPLTGSRPPSSSGAACPALVNLLFAPCNIAHSWGIQSTLAAEGGKPKNLMLNSFWGCSNVPLAIVWKAVRRISAPSCVRQFLSSLITMNPRRICFSNSAFYLGRAGLAKSGVRLSLIAPFLGFRSSQSPLRCPSARVSIHCDKSLCCTRRGGSPLQSLANLLPCFCVAFNIPQAPVIVVNKFAANSAKIGNPETLGFLPIIQRNNFQNSHFWSNSNLQQPFYPTRLMGQLVALCMKKMRLKPLTWFIGLANIAKRAISRVDQSINMRGKFHMSLLPGAALRGASNTRGAIAFGFYHVSGGKETCYEGL